MLKGDRCNTPKCAMVKRNYPPGFHGPKGRKRPTDFGLQLTEKQKAKKQYNILEKQFKLTFEKAQKQAGNAGENFLILLETRLDNVIYRAGFASSRNKARQIINHGHINVNGKKVDIPSYQVNSGEIIKFRIKGNNKIYQEILQRFSSKASFDVPGWLHVETKELSIKILRKPSPAEIQTNINLQVIVEYYSR